MQKSSNCSYYRAGKEIKKRRFLHPDDAIREVKKLNMKPNRIHIMSAYKCTTCQMFHIGKSHKLKESTGIYKQ